jgi:hypothetical protein
MDSTRISIARVIELGVQVSWREAAAIIHEAVSQTGPTKGARPSRVSSDACLLTRGGEVVLTGEAQKARPETVVRLLEDLLAVCDSPGGLASALESGTALAFLEDLSQRTTPKRRRVEIASVALRALAAAADRAREESDEREAALAEPEREPPPRAPVPFAEYAARHDAPATVHAPAHAPVPPTPFTRANVGLAASASASALRVVEPPATEFDTLRAEVAAREEARQRALEWGAIVERLKRLDKRVVTAVVVPIVVGATWYLWPAGPLRPPPRPTDGDPVPLAAVPLPPSWADIGRVGRRAPVPSAASTAPPPAATVPPEVARAAAPAAPAEPVDAPEPRADASVSLIPPPGAPPAAATPAPAAAVRPPATTSASSSPPATGEVSAPASIPTPTAAPALNDAVYSWTSAGVQPPSIRYPPMPSWALPEPGATIDGPYLEVLVDQQGQVETVRIRGRVDPGETFYRHRMMLASAKLWQFTPARLNGQPVRYVVRVLVDQP